MYIKNMTRESIDQTIHMLYGQGQWKDIADLELTAHEFKTSRLFWVLPTLNDLQWMSDMVKNYGLVGVVSIGCGCGLLEWLFQKYSGLNVSGIELDRSWWCSNYAPPLFLKNITFVPETNANCHVSKDYALLFCYFNNALAFRSYIENYKGNLVIVIGPDEGQDRTSSPLPFDKTFEALGWQLAQMRKMTKSRDYIVAYIR